MQVRNIVAKVVISSGYRPGPSSNWYRHFPDLIHVIGLQRSTWAGEYYLEFGIWLRAFGPEESPKYYECHVRLRLSAELGSDFADIDSALRQDDEWKMDSEERTRILTVALQRVEAVFLNKAQTVEDLRSLLISRHNLDLAVNKRVWELLGIT